MQFISFNLDWQDPRLGFHLKQASHNLGLLKVLAMFARCNHRC